MEEVNTLGNTISPARSVKANIKRRDISQNSARGKTVPISRNTNVKVCFVKETGGSVHTIGGKRTLASARPAMLVSLVGMKSARVGTEQ